MGEIRKSSSKKDSSELSIRDVVVMDQTHSEFRITLWNDSVNRADSWLPKQTSTCINLLSNFIKNDFY